MGRRKGPERPYHLNMTLTIAERDTLFALQETELVSGPVSDYVRRLIMREGARLKVVLPPKSVEEEEEHAADEGPSGVREVSVAAFEKELKRKAAK